MIDFFFALRFAPVDLRRHCTDGPSCGIYVNVAGFSGRLRERHGVQLDDYIIAVGAHPSSVYEYVFGEQSELFGRLRGRRHE